MNVFKVNGGILHNAINSASVPTKMVNRKMLKPTASQLKNLCGPEEVQKAKILVAGAVATTSATAAATAQMPITGEVALAAEDVAMAMGIYNGIYNFKLSKTIVQGLVTALAGNRIGTTVFKWSARWIPIFGNAVNATIAGSTTAALGAAIIESAESMDKARKRGESIDDFIKKLSGK